MLEHIGACDANKDDLRYELVDGELDHVIFEQSESQELIPNVTEL